MALVGILEPIRASYQQPEEHFDLTIIEFIQNYQILRMKRSILVHSDYRV